MTDKVKGLKGSCVTVFVETKSGYSSHETFSTNNQESVGGRDGDDPTLPLLNAVDEINRMLLLGGVPAETLAFRLNTVVDRVKPQAYSPDGQDKEKAVPIKNLHEGKYPG